MKTFLRSAIAKLLASLQTEPAIANPEFADETPSQPAADVIVAGDSHCLAFDNMSLPHDGRTVVFRSAFCSSPEGLRASNLAQVGDAGSAEINSVLAAMLKDADIFQQRPNGKAPAVLLTLGGIDTIEEAQNSDWQTFDILAADHPDLVDRNLKCFPSSLHKARLDAAFANLAEGLAILKSQIPGPFAVISMPPPHAENTLLDEHCRARGMTVDFAPPLTRWKITHITKQKIISACDTAGVTYIDTWPETSEARFLASAYELDGFHGNRDYAERSGQMALMWLAGQE